MRMRKKHWAIPFLESIEDLVIQNPELYKGKWKQKLEKDILRVEIGIGKGGYFDQMSKKYISDGWVGIEKELNVAAIAAKKLTVDNLDNRLIITKDAKDITEWFNEKEIDIIHLNFSDPWQKNSTKKRRLSHSKFVKQYYKLLNDDGRVIMKTDNSKLFEFSIIEFNKNGFYIEDISVDYKSELHEEDAISEYEEKFKELNKPIYRVIFRKGVNNE